MACWLTEWMQPSLSLPTSHVLSFFPIIFPSVKSPHPLFPHSLKMMTKTQHSSFLNIPNNIISLENRQYYYNYWCWFHKQHNASTGRGAITFKVNAKKQRDAISCQVSCEVPCRNSHSIHTQHSTAWVEIFILSMKFAWRCVALAYQR